MSQTAAAKPGEQSIEYSIYVYHHPVAQKGTAPELVGAATANMKDAIKKAEGLHASGNYHKVEVKQKYIDPKNNRQIEMTLKMLEFRPKKPLGVGVILLFTLICGAAAFGLTVFLMGGKP